MCENDKIKKEQAAQPTKKSPMPEYIFQKDEIAVSTYSFLALSSDKESGLDLRGVSFNFS